MAVADFFSKLRIQKSVLKRTRKRDDLPREALYVEWLSGEGRRKVLDTRGKEHLITDKVLQSNYKLATGSDAKKLIATHWASTDEATPSTSP